MSLDLGELSGTLGLDMSPFEQTLKMAEGALVGFASSGEAAAKKAGDGIGAGLAGGVDEAKRLLDELPKNAQGTVSETSAEFRALGPAMKAAVLDAKAAAAAGLAQIPAEARSAGAAASAALGAGLASAETEAKNAGRDAGKGFSEEFKANAKDAGKAVGAVVGAGLGVGVADNINIDAGRRRLTAQLNLTAGDAKVAGKLAGSVYSDNFGEDLPQINDAIALVIKNTNLQLGSVDIQPAVEKILTLADTFDQDLGGTTAAVGQMVRTGMVKDVSEGLDILTKGLQGPANKADDLMDTMNEYGTQFRNLGIDGKTAMGLIQQAMQGGARDSDIAADAIKEFSLRTQGALEQMDSKGRAIMTPLGQAITNVIKPGQDMYKVQEDLAKGGPRARKAFDTMIDGLRGIKDPVARAQTATQLFGTQAEDLGKALYKMDPSTAAKELGDFAGAADKVNATTGGGAQATIETYRRQIVGWGRDAIEATGPGMAAAGAVAAFGPAALSVLGPVAQLVAARGLQTAAASTAATAESAASGSVVMGWARSAAASTWGAAKMAASWLIAMGPIALVIAAVVGIAVLIYKNWDDIKRVTAQVWGWVVDHTVGAWNAVKHGVSRGVSAALGFVRAHWPLLVGILTGPIGFAVAMVIKHWDKIKASTARAWQWVKSTTTGAWTAVKDAVVGKAMAMVAWVAGLPSRIVDKIMPLGRRLLGAGRTAFEQLKGGMVAAAGGVLNYVTGFPDRLVRGFGNLGSLLYGKGQDLIYGLWNGIKSMGSWLKDNLLAWVAEHIPGPIAHVLGMSSRSRSTSASREVPGPAPAGRAAGITVNVSTNDPSAAAKETVRRLAWAGGA